MNRHSDILTDPRVSAVPAAALLAMVVLWATDANTAAFLALNGAASLLPDIVWAALTVSGDGLVLFALMLPLVGRRPDLLRALLVAAVIATLWTHGLKPFFAVPRPAAVLDPELFHIIGQRLGAANAFPSGHATGAMTFTATLALLLPARWFLPIISAGLLIAFSRIAVGAHWPLDVAAGVLGGWLAAAVAVRLAPRWRGGLSLTTQRILAPILLACAIWLPWANLYEQTTSWLQLLIAVTAIAVSLPALMRLYRSNRTLPGKQTDKNEG